MPSLNIMQTLLQIQSATLRARSATATQGIGTRVEKGRFQVVNTTFRKNGSAIIDELSGWISSSDAVSVLDQIAEDRAFRA
jgi:hypothetical protein